MQFLADLSYWARVIMIIVIAAGIIFVALAVYLFKIRKPKDELEQEEIYGQFKRTSAISYLPFKKIEQDMIIMEDEKTFVGAIICKGIDFFSSHISEQKTVVDGYISHIGALTEPVQLRVTTKGIDMEEPIAKYQESLQEYTKKIRELYEDGLITIANYRKTTDSSERVLYEEEINRINKELETYKWKYNHCNNIVEYMKSLSSVEASKIAPVREEGYVFSWYFNESEYPADITKQEIYNKANEELESIASQFIHSLSRAGVKATRARTKQLQEMARRHMQPYGSNIYKNSDLRNSNINEPVFSSNVLEDYEKRYKEALDNDIRQGLEAIFTQEDEYSDYSISDTENVDYEGIEV